MPSQEEIDKLHWFHTIELTDGKVTPGSTNYRQEMDRFLFPDVKGKDVADIGTFDGFWAVESLKQGASYVEAHDLSEHATGKLVLGDYGITHNVGIDFNLHQTWKKHFDVVLFYGVIYHLYNPTQGLRNAYDLVKPGGILVVESAVNQGESTKLPDDVPSLWIIPGQWAGDASNYVMPNRCGLRQMCKLLVGSEILEESSMEQSERFTVKVRKGK